MFDTGKVREPPALEFPRDVTVWQGCMKRSNIRVCLCLSGQMRSFERNFDWLSQIDERIQLKIVIATWAKRGGKITGALNSARMKGLFSEALAASLPISWLGPELFERFPDLHDAAKKRSETAIVSATLIKKVFPVAQVHIEDELPFTWFERSQMKEGGITAPDPYSLSMLYKVWQADNMRRNMEAESGEEFDVLIRARPDFPFEPPSYEFLTTLSEKELYVDRFDKAAQSLGDGFAIGRRHVMSQYSTFFLQAVRRGQARQWTYIHDELYAHVSSMGIELRTYPMLGYSPDRLLFFADVRKAIAEHRSGPSVDVSKDIDLRIIERSLKIAEAVENSDVTASLKAMFQHLTCLAVTFDHDRDGGFIEYLALRFVKDERPFEALTLLCILMKSNIREFSEELLNRISNAVAEVSLSLISLGLPGSLEMGSCIDRALIEIGDTECGKLLSELTVTAEDKKHIELAFRAMNSKMIRDRASWTRQAEWAHRFRQYDLQERVLRAGLEEIPGDSGYTALLACALASFGRSVEAIELARAASNSEAGRDRFLCGKAFMLSDMPVEAERLFSELIREYPSDGDNYMVLSEALALQGRLDEAVDVGTVAADLSPFPMAHRHNHLAGLLARTGRLTDALAVYKEVLRRNPEWSDVAVQIKRLENELVPMTAEFVQPLVP